MRIVDPETLARSAPARSARSGCAARAWRGLLGPARADRARPSSAHLAGEGDGPFLRTGDLGFLADGRAVRHRPPQGPHHHPRAQPLPAGPRGDGGASHPALRPGRLRRLLRRRRRRGAAGDRARGGVARVPTPPRSRPCARRDAPSTTSWRCTRWCWRAVCRCPAPPAARSSAGGAVRCCWMGPCSRWPGWPSRAPAPGEAPATLVDRVARTMAELLGVPGCCPTTTSSGWAGTR